MNQFKVTIVLKVQFFNYPYLFIIFGKTENFIQGNIL